PHTHRYHWYRGRSFNLRASARAHTHTHTTGVQRGPGVGGALEPGRHVGRLRLRPQQMQSVP
ncbi:MAG: hypothetical protein ACK55Z_02255, partial [bacterium]